VKKTRIGNLSPLSLAALAVGIALVTGAIALHEVRQARREVLGVLQQEAMSLIESIAIAGEGAIRSYEEIEGLVAERLLDSGRLLRRLDDRGMMSPDLLTRIAEENRIHRIQVYGRDGGLIARVPPDGRDRGPGGRAPEGMLDRLQDQEETVLGFHESEGEPGPQFSVAVRRTEGGAILLSVDAAHMRDFRKSIGVGKLLQDIGDNPGIAYVLLQDEEGIVLASRGIRGFPPIAEDPFLQAAMRIDTPSSRVTRYAGRETFEVVKPFLVLAGQMGLLRVGLSMEAVGKAEWRVIVRVGFVIGLLTGAAAVFIGLIAVRQSHALLRRAHARLESATGNILSGMADAVLALDRDGRITVFNRAAERIFGASAAEAIGRAVSDIVAAPNVEMTRALSGADPEADLECPCETRDGRRLVLSIRTAPLRDDEGRSDGLVAVIQDLTGRKRLEEDARRRDRLTAMGELASGVAHEVRNPLNAIGVISQRLAREFSPSDGEGEYRGLLDTIRSEVTRVNGIVQQFLDFARPPRLAPAPTDVARLLEESIRIVESRAGEKGLVIRRGFDGLGEARLDAGQMKQALLNLLTNAVDATDRGEIAVRASRGERLEIVVSDTGRGIPPDQLSRVFDLYFTTRADGTGLGLSLVQRIVADHGGRIHVESEVGKGTTFTLTLPGS
jgi:PAS domain S-box-containing protein